MPTNSSRSVACRRWCVHASRPNQESRFLGLSRACAAMSMFSMTVSRGKIRVSWKVRPIPVANTLSGAALVITVSPNQTWPSSALS